MGVLDNKAVVITGGAGVLGAAYADAMAREGARLVVNDIDADAGELAAPFEVVAVAGEERVALLRELATLGDGGGLERGHRRFTSCSVQKPVKGVRRPAA
ncbi:MAG: hypothetical protein IIB12_07800 [Chloroflexi bacterium]|nr:hypothetical protein [Chloroflexota bacterium]